MEPWEEALDLDDSDIPSLLRPCKRHHRQTSISAAATTTSTSLSQPTLRPCSNRPQTLVIEEETEQQQHQEQQRQQFSRPISPQRRRIIPGPAGAVQSAMLQKNRDREKEHLFSSQTSDSNPIPTQEYIRRAVENAPEFDDDFSSDPWLSALQFIGTVDGVVPSVPLNSIHQCANNGKVDQVVAVIKSCTQSSLGGLMVTLKDPTGTICASVHQKVLSESHFAKDFVNGSVLILQKVSIFSSSKLMHYLNIMPRNLVKVVNKDNGPPTEKSSLAYSVKHVAPGGAGSPEKRSTPENGASGEMTDRMQHNIDASGSLHINDQIESRILLNQSLTCSSRLGLKAKLVDKEPSSLRQDAAQGLSEEAASKRTGYNEEVVSLDNERGLKVADINERLHNDDVAKSLMTNHVVQEIQEDNTVQKQRQPVTSATLPQWTDEQLEELFACDDEDGGSYI
ncbi:uncharacterized protein [Coffea arabica]|uniref:Uncharacterized protein C17orf53 homolog n=1 Tax=Coffea arabica TaxID=13443 RepID=A0A6P6XCD6_COFAR|nr:uncharacterized protein C17orf53 homolog [Coffea arabica]XP_027125423.1 uncharacterized protein C17orf53 homolog [Coffea arabica]